MTRAQILVFLSSLSVLSLLPMMNSCATAPRGAESTVRFARLAHYPADDAVRAVDLLRPVSGVWRYEIVAGDAAGSILDLSRTRTDQFGAAWADEEGDLRTEYWVADPGGDVLLMAVHDYADDAISFFDPPLSLPHELQAGQRHTQRTNLRVVDARNHDRQRASGTAERTLEYVDNQRIRTPAGEVTAQRVVVHFRADLNLATAETTTTYYVVPGTGVIASDSSERITVFGVFGRSDDRTMVLVEEAAD